MAMLVVLSVQLCHVTSCITLLCIAESWQTFVGLNHGIKALAGHKTIFNTYCIKCLYNITCLYFGYYGPI